MTAAWLSRRWVQDGLVWLPAGLGLGHGVVDCQDDSLGAVLPPALLVLAFNNGEGLQDVGGVLPIDAVKVKIQGVQFTADEEAALFVPAEKGGLL